MAGAVVTLAMNRSSPFGSNAPDVGFWEIVTWLGDYCSASVLSQPIDLFTRVPHTDAHTTPKWPVAEEVP